ncbi:MAG: L-threonylcarbamoyladenylate synthase [Candidatus Nanopelagicales bacterium]
MNITDVNNVENIDEVIAKTVLSLRAGEIIGVNADSSYALLADAFSHTAVPRIQNLKKSEGFVSPIMVGRAYTVQGLAEVTSDMQLLMDAFWPGNLTLLLKPMPSLSWKASKDAISVRMPRDHFTLKLLENLGPAYVVSANAPGRNQPTTAAQAANIWGSDVKEWFDTGVIEKPEPSTIIDMRDVKANITRLGSLSLAEIRKVLPSVTMVA